MNRQVHTVIIVHSSFVKNAINKGTYIFDYIETIQKSTNDKNIDYKKRKLLQMPVKTLKIIN